MRFLLMLASLIASPAAAQIHVLNPFAPSHLQILRPFAAAQGSVAPLVASASTSAAYPCAAPPVLPTGYWARNKLSWLGQYWGDNSGGTWNAHVQSYALCLGTSSDYLRFELHDTQYDHGLNDPSTKRRDEIGSSNVYRNNVEYWIAYSFRTTWGNPAQTGEEQTEMQVHWPSGSSPAYSQRVVSFRGGMGLRITVKNDATNNSTLVTVPLAAGVHDTVVHFRLGAASFEQTWLDGKQISSYTGQFGSLKEDGYSQRFGPYGATMKGNTVVEEFKNLVILSTADLSARTSAAPAW